MYSCLQEAGEDDENEREITSQLHPLLVIQKGGFKQHFVNWVQNILSPKDLHVIGTTWTTWLSRETRES